MKRKIKKLIGMVLTASFLFGVMPPVPVEASENTISFSSAILRQGNIVYFGQGQRGWNVISTNGNGGTYSDGEVDVSASDAVFLLATEGMFSTKYRYGGAGIDYAGSVLRGNLLNAAADENYFSPEEQKAILKTTKEDHDKMFQVDFVSAGGDGSDYQYQLTLLDESRKDFSIGTASVSTDPSGDQWITVPYSGAKTGENEYISVIAVSDQDNTITHYGHVVPLKNPDQAEGTASFRLASSYDPSEETLYIFSEQYNGLRSTDYASELQKVSVGNASLHPGADAIDEEDTICYGTDENGNALTWSVLSEDGNGGTYSDGTSAVDADDALFLLSETAISETHFSSSWASDYAQSNLRKVLHTETENRFSKAEQEAMLQTTKEAKGNSDFPLQEQQPIACTNPSLDGDQLFSLSAEELIRYMGYNSWVGTGLGGLENGKSWWLRSVSLVEGGGAGLVDPGGSIKLSDMCNAQGIRPGFNLDKGAVLFMSPAEGGKISTGDAGALTKLTPVSGISQWKLTITDSRHSGFSIEKGEISGNTATVAYSGAATGENEFISAIIKDEYGEITHYGRIAGTPDGDDESGSVSIKLPVGFDSDQDTLYLFSEQYNGDRKTDYASGLKKASLQDKSVQIDMDVLAAPGNSIYFGANGLSWKVVAKGGNGGTYSDGTSAVDAYTVCFRNGPDRAGSRMYADAENAGMKILQGNTWQKELDMRKTVI